MSDLEDKFEDPALREAVRRSAGGEAAPPALRQRVEMLFAAAAIVNSPAGRARGSASFWKPQASWRLAASVAFAVVALSWIAIEIRQELFPQAQAVRLAALGEFPVAFASEAVRAHDNFVKVAVTRPAPADDFAALKTQLTNSTGLGVFAAELGDGWKLKSAGTNEVSNQKSAYLLYQRNGDTVSVCTMPLWSLCEMTARRYQQTQDQHTIVGFARGDALYVIIGSHSGEPMSVGQLEPVLSRVQEEIGGGTCGSGSSSRPSHRNVVR